MARGISLHVGLNEVDPVHYGGWVGTLNACEADAEDMQELAVERGFEAALLLTATATRQAVVFDSGADCEPLLEIVRENDLSVELILLTHSHVDHVVDLPRLVKGVGSPPVWINALESDDEDFPSRCGHVRSGSDLPRRRPDH